MLWTACDGHKSGETDFKIYFTWCFEQHVMDTKVVKQTLKSLLLDVLNSMWWDSWQYGARLRKVDFKAQWKKYSTGYLLYKCSPFCITNWTQKSSVLVFAADCESVRLKHLQRWLNPYSSSFDAKRKWDDFEIRPTGSAALTNAYDWSRVFYGKEIFPKKHEVMETELSEAV